MDNQFNTLMRSYHDNYLQYKLTGDQKYQTAYQAAEKGLDAIILAKNQAVQSDAQNIQNALGVDSESKMKDIKSQAIHLGQGLVDEHDAKESEKLSLATPAPTPVQPVFQYIAIGVLLAKITGLSFFV